MSSSSNTVTATTITDAMIRALHINAGTHGDFDLVHICEVALGWDLEGSDAIDWARAHGLTLSKYADPSGDACDGLTPSEAAEVAAEYPSLIYVTPTARQVQQARQRCAEVIADAIANDGQ